MLKTKLLLVTVSLALAATMLSAGKKDTTNPPPVKEPKGKKSEPLAPVSNLVTASALAPVGGTQPRDMRLLVITATGGEPSFDALKFFLDYLGTPYETVIAASQPLPALTDGMKGRYQGILIVTGNLGVCDPACRSLLPEASWAALDAYARDYKVRTVAYYAWPEKRYGLTAIAGFGTDTTPVTASYTAAAASVFPYLNRSNPLPISGAWMYTATPAPDPGETTVPLLTVQGATVAALHTKADGREYLTVTMDNSQYLTHSNALNYGIFNWVTKGVFLGSRRIYLSTQNDDFFLPNDQFVNGVAACMPGGFTNDPTFDPADQCPTVRMSPADLDNIRKWQDGLNAKAQFAKVKTSMVFNGYGSSYGPDSDPKDPLTAKAVSLKSKFYWVNHTWDHETLDCFLPAPNSSTCRAATYAESLAEISQNVSAAKKMGLPLDGVSMVTPGISGLNNPDFMKAAKDSGIRFLIGDTSRPEGNPAKPNTGIISPLQPSIMIIPRRATNVFYNTYSGKAGVNGSLPDEYNYFYGPSGIFGGFFPTTQTYADIVDRESNMLVMYMLRYEIYPTMWHQSNFVRYQGDKTLFTDVVDAALQKFAKISNLPVISLEQYEIGNEMYDRMGYNASQLTATLTPGVNITLTAQNAAKVPVTGICKGTCISYGGQSLSKIQVGAGGTVQVPLY